MPSEDDAVAILSEIILNNKKSSLMQSARLDFSVSLPFVVSKRRSQLYEFGLSLTESAVVSEPQALCEFNSVVEMKAIVFR